MMSNDEFCAIIQPQERKTNMEDTIVAISTALGVGAISIVRVSGKEAISVVKKVFTNANFGEAPSHTIHYGYIKDQNENIDEVLVMLMRAPKTYTTEDTVEINCHGGINTTNKIVEVLLKNGCRLAEPGEFTKRAFLNGRINLVEAESVNDLITAKTDAARNMALNNVGGMLSSKIKNLRAKMVQVLANIEVNIDYPEYEDELEVTHNILNKNLAEISTELQKLIADSKNGRLIKEGINVAIVGKPNVGKSSILNTLLDEEKAIVTNIPGTTRDIVEGSISLNGILLNFIDTAGIRETDDEVEKIGVIKSKKIASTADLILFVVSNNEKISNDELELLKEFPREKLLILINKSDLKTKIDVDKLKGYEYFPGNIFDTNGLDKLKEAIINKFNLGKIITKDVSYISNLRQIELVNKAYKSLENASLAEEKKLPIDIIEIDLRDAWEYLGELIGDAYNEELVDNIFANFCLGK